jgi:hypothetical protein
VGCTRGIRFSGCVVRVGVVGRRVPLALVMVEMMLAKWARSLEVDVRVDAAWEALRIARRLTGSKVSFVGGAETVASPTY